MNKLTVKQIKQILDGTTNIEDPIIKKCEDDDRKGVQQLLTRWLKQQEEHHTQQQLFIEMSTYEKSLYKQGYNSIAGIDEVGRGPLAGPVVAAAVILPKDFYLPGLNDSKKLSFKKREYLYDYIMEHAVTTSVGIVSAQKIDEINIYQATKYAMKQAIEDLNVQPDFLLIDAMELSTDLPQLSIIKGDSKSIAIAASSIVAKVTRDRIMINLAEEFPQYQFEKHMGYGTKEHMTALQQFGVTREHRKTFSPVRETLEMVSEV
ncbi:ribonuclease HII [Bacillus sp. SCS-151]|uniref:ribonuclease HII n=1 Tax=Nanhaiella sioensis TaxID=3115293 RepID=UPI003977E4DB